MTYFGAVDCVVGRIVEVVGILRNSETFRNIIEVGILRRGHDVDLSEQACLLYGVDCPGAWLSIYAALRASRLNGTMQNWRLAPPPRNSTE